MRDAWRLWHGRYAESQRAEVPQAVRFVEGEVLVRIVELQAQQTVAAQLEVLAQLSQILESGVAAGTLEVIAAAGSERDAVAQRVAEGQLHL
jgi:hypothetical protein